MSALYAYRIAQLCTSVFQFALQDIPNCSTFRTYCTLLFHFHVRINNWLGLVSCWRENLPQPQSAVASFSTFNLASIVVRGQWESNWKPISLQKIEIALLWRLVISSAVFGKFIESGCCDFDDRNGAKRTQKWFFAIRYEMCYACSCRGSSGFYLFLEMINTPACFFYQNTCSRYGLVVKNVGFNTNCLSTRNSW